MFRERYRPILLLLILFRSRCTDPCVYIHRFCSWINENVLLRQNSAQRTNQIAPVDN
uniref:Secreted protein n=1 Tax=Aegilops tauschii subsp. strangulata TaxID=200361 RepID=A0A453RKZ4_AEGTS